jgi:hypothetical protein
MAEWWMSTNCNTTSSECLVSCVFAKWWYCYREQVRIYMLWVHYKKIASYKIKVTRYPDFSGTVLDFVKGNWGCQFIQNLVKLPQFIPVQRIFLDIREFLKVRKLSWSYSVSLTTPVLAMLLHTMLTTHGNIMPFFLWMVMHRDWVFRLCWLCRLVGCHGLLFILDFYE